MADNVIVQVAGGTKQILEGVYTVGDCRKKLGLPSNYTATVDGTSASDSTSVRGGNFVSFAEAVKGA